MNALRTAIAIVLMRACTCLDRIPRWDRTERRWHRWGDWGCTYGLMRLALRVDPRPQARF
jgi:hypothetical protein